MTRGRGQTSLRVTSVSVVSRVSVSHQPERHTCQQPHPTLAPLPLVRMLSNMLLRIPRSASPVHRWPKLATDGMLSWSLSSSTAGRSFGDAASQEASAVIHTPAWACNSQCWWVGLQTFETDAILLRKLELFFDSFRLRLRSKYSLHHSFRGCF